MVLNFHKVSPHSRFSGEAVDPADFATLVGNLKRSCQLVALDQLPELSPSSGPFAVITFDDGYKDFVEYAMPILDHHRIRANQNVIAGSVETGMPPWTTQIGDYFASAPKALLKSLCLHGSEPKDLVSPVSLSGFLKSRSITERRPVWEEFCAQFRDVDVSFTPMMSASDVRTAGTSHLIGCHSWGHESMEYEPFAYFEEDFDRCSTYFDEVLGLHLKVYAFPNGSYRTEQVSLLESKGVTSILLVGERPSRVANSVHTRITMYGSSEYELRMRALGFRRRYIGSRSRRTWQS